jgi:hypothetical protein
MRMYVCLPPGFKLLEVVLETEFWNNLAWNMYLGPVSQYSTRRARFEKTLFLEISLDKMLSL